MMLLSTPDYAALAAQLQRQYEMRSCQWEAHRFANGEWHLTLDAPVRNECCVLFASITPPDEHLITTLLLSHTRRKEGAARVTAFLPYLAYTRQDKDEAGQSMATAWVGTLLAASGIDEVVTLDIHSDRAQALMRVPVRSLSPALLWAAEIQRQGWTDATTVAPDHGAIVRCETVRQAAGISAPIAWFEKHRARAGVESSLHGTAGARAIIIDDILDTGGTFDIHFHNVYRAEIERLGIASHLFAVARK